MEVCVSKLTFDVSVEVKKLQVVDRRCIRIHFLNVSEEVKKLQVVDRHSATLSTAVDAIRLLSGEKELFSE